MYLDALETRLHWLQWAMQQTVSPWAGVPLDVLRQYKEMLLTGETFYMAAPFCDLVTHAAKTIPDGTGFEHAWLIQPSGWLYLDTPFIPPPLIGFPDTPVPIRAIAWMPRPAGTPVYSHGAGSTVTTLTIQATQFLCYHDAHGKFTPWSYFLIGQGAPLRPTIETYEARARSEGKTAAEYIEEFKYDRHEIRWIYAAMYLMNQRLAVNSQQQPNRALRRRWDREGDQRLAPVVRVVTLRRLAQEQQRTGISDVDWQCQWHVRGHWRNQWYASEQTHRPKFIEAYIKGPADKPLKDVTHTVFIAKR